VPTRQTREPENVNETLKGEEKGAEDWTVRKNTEYHSWGAQRGGKKGWGTTRKITLDVHAKMQENKAIKASRRKEINSLSTGGRRGIRMVQKKGLWGKGFTVFRRRDWEN